MSCLILGGLLGFAFGSVISGLLFGPDARAVRAQRPALRRSGNPGAAFLFLTVSMFGGMAAGGLAGL